MAGDDLKDTIKDNAQGPAEARGDSGSIRQHSLKDQIEADRYLASRKAAAENRLGFLLVRLVPPGAV